MNTIDSCQQIDPHRHFVRAAAYLIAIVAAVTLAVTSSAFARQSATHLKVFHAPAAAPNTHVPVDRNDPALTGGGSLGYNQAVERGY